MRAYLDQVVSFFDLVDGRIGRHRLFLHAELPEPVVIDTSRPGRGATRLP